MTQADLLRSESLRFRLRHATDAAHRRLEESLALQDRCRSTEGYAAVIARMWGMYAPLEAELARVDLGALGLDMESRFKAGWLLTDLAALGFSARDIAALPRAARIPVLDDPVDALGVLYVVEGAALGGQVISRQLEARLSVTSQSGGRFFASYGARVGETWRAYLAVLEATGATPDAAARIEAAALDTFACFEAWLGEWSFDPAGRPEVLA